MPAVCSKQVTSASVVLTTARGVCLTTPMRLKEDFIEKNNSCFWFG